MCWLSDRESEIDVEVDSILVHFIVNKRFTHIFINVVVDYLFLKIYVAATSGRVRFFLLNVGALQVLHFFPHSYG